jgi:hypothetical protein
MYCLVDHRNRPQFSYTFHSSAKAREYIRKIKNNPLGITVIYRDGRREYFEHGLPAELRAAMQTGLPKDFNKSQNKTWKIKRGFHIKYSLQKLSTLDSARFSSNCQKSSFSQKSWGLFDSWPIFMLGNKKFYTCLFTIILLFSYSTYFFQKNYSTAIGPGIDSAASKGKVLGASFAKVLSDEQANNEPALKLADETVIINLLEKIKEEKEGEFEKEILAYLKGKPMENMAPYIAKQPRTVAAFIVGIAMKESKFGLYAPHDASGNDCHNYWGYRGLENTTASGYSCFATPEQAIHAVGKRIAKLVDQGASNPSEMVVWKCGASCSWDNPENVRKWISDVGINFYKINS